jgi:deazaflavin-dependent oxidoreductase (nitroreductase family)
MTAFDDAPTMHSRGAARAPRFVRLLSPLLQPLIGRGLPAGPNVLITIRGRTSGVPRTTPVAIIEVDGRRWIWSPWGAVHWALNLRAAGRATLTVRGREEDVVATELDEAERVVFFRDTFTPFAKAMRGGVAFVRLIDGVVLDDPAEVASRTRVFELHPAH